jgi:hypothetical protein
LIGDSKQESEFTLFGDGDGGGDNMEKRKWSYNPTSLLLSTTMHILTQCTYTEAHWQALAASYDLQDYHQIALRGGPVEWVRYMSSGGNKDVQREETWSSFSRSGG